MAVDERETIASRLKSADIGTKRFIDVVDGEKKSVNHDREEPGDVSGNYGIYATAADDLVIIDIDDYDDLEDPAGYRALDELPDTFEQESPHGGTHRFYAVNVTADGRLISAALKDVFGKPNLAASWGEIRTDNQYVVGAGSQLDGCGKDWCDSCADENGGKYTIAEDRGIARIDADELIAAFEADPEIERAEKRPTRELNGPVSEANIDVYDVISRAYEPGKRHGHPMHGSETGSNFQVDDNGETWRCWRHSTTGNALHLIGMEEGILSCGEWDNSMISRKQWAEIYDAARDRGLDVGDPPQPVDSTSNFDDTEVERGERILKSQTSPESPVGELTYHNGGYGVPWSNTDSDGNVIDEGVDQVTNFTMETQSVLDTEESETSELVIRVHPNHPADESYDVRVEPSVFNSSDSFAAEVVTGSTTWYDPSNRKTIPRSTILRYLRETVAAQPAPHRTGQSYIGLSDDGTEFVTPVGSITPDGWADDPDYEFYSKGGDGHKTGPLQQKWEIEAEQEIGIDDSDVARICELIASIRAPERGLPILGWFYAAPVKALIHEWEREFPLLAPHGDTGTGKTSGIETFMQAFGGTGEPLSSTDTKFTKEKHLAESRGFPIWIDEYKPTEMSESYRNHLHQRLKEVTKERTMPKGRPDMGMDMLHMRAPVVLSGEQKVSDPAVRRRSILTNLTREPTRDGTPEKAAFGELTGTSYSDESGEQHHPDGMDLRCHAIAYYRWVLDHETGKLQAFWRQARQRTKEILKAHGITLEASEERALQTIIFGCRIHHEFASSFGADETALPTAEDIESACLHVVENIGKDGQRREHADEFLELLSLAATEEYIEPGINHRVLKSQNHGIEVLAVHMPSCYSAVKRYVRDSNLEDQYNILSKTDYSNSFANKAESGNGYVIDTNKQTRGIENGRRAIHFDPDAITDKLGGDFNLDVFRPESERVDADDDMIAAATPLTELSAPSGGSPYRTVTIEIRSWAAGSDAGPAEKGVVVDATGVVDMVDWFGCEVSGTFEEGKCYLIENARVSTYEGAVQLEIVKDVTEAKPIQTGAGHTSAADTDAEQSGLEAATDGGAEPEQIDYIKTLRSLIDEIGPASEDEIVDKAVDEGFSTDRAEEMLDRFIKQGQVLRTSEGIELK